MYKSHNNLTLPKEHRVIIMKTLIICFSYHHKNTEKIASALAKILDAEVKAPAEVDPNRLGGYDLLGFWFRYFFWKKLQRPA